MGLGPFAGVLALAVHTESCLSTRFRSKEISRSGGLHAALDRCPMPILLAWGEHDVTADPQALAHELAHIRRHDYLVNLVQLLIEAVFFFNPAVIPDISARCERTPQTCKTSPPGLVVQQVSVAERRPSSRVPVPLPTTDKRTTDH